MNLADEIDAALAALGPAATARLRDLRRTFSKRLREAPGRKVVRDALSLRKRGGFVRHFIACELVRHHRAALSSLGPRDLEAFGSGLDGWAAVDVFSTYLAGPAWRGGQVPDRWVYGWARSPDRWRRRAALVATVPLNSKAHGGLGDAPRTLRVCSILASDRDDMVVKALSWALRELAKRDATAVEGFLRREGERLAPRVRREVRNKLRTGKKNP